MATWGEEFVLEGLKTGGQGYSLPFMKTLGFDQTLELRTVGDGETEFVWETDKSLVSMDGIVQGGIVSAVADICQGYTYMSALDKFHAFSTADMTVRFLRPVKAGSTIQVLSFVRAATRQTKVIESSFEREDGTSLVVVSAGWRAAQRDFAQ